MIPPIKLGPAPGTQTIQVPAQVVVAIQQQTLQGVVQLLLSGQYERSDLVPAVVRRIIADAIVTAANNPGMERAPCDNCSRVRAEHPLSDDGFRYCAAEKVDDGASPEPPKRFQPGKPRIVLAGPGGMPHG